MSLFLPIIYPQVYPITPRQTRNVPTSIHTRWNPHHPIQPWRHTIPYQPKPSPLSNPAPNISPETPSRADESRRTTLPAFLSVYSTPIPLFCKAAWELGSGGVARSLPERCAISRTLRHELAAGRPGPTVWLAGWRIWWGNWIPAACCA